MYFSTSGVLTTAADLSDVVYESFHLRITALDHGDPPRSSHVDIIVVVDASIPYTDRHRGRQDRGEDEAAFIDANLPFIVALLGFCAAFIVIVIVLIAVAAAVCGSRRRSRPPRQVRLDCLIISDNGGGKCDCPRCSSVCLSVSKTSLDYSKNASMDLDDILHVDRCRDMDELINF